jgi:HAD superfamily hydrolase (TIGR01662 family)
MAYRRRALRALGGFDERFRRAYREDADLGIRALAGGWRLTVGCRRIVHPVRPAPWHVSIANQRGNADDALMSRVHGSAWREMASAPRGAFRSHVAVTVAAAAAVAAAVARRPGIAILGALTWLLATLRFMARRLRGTSRDPKDAAAMAITSVVIPPVAVWHRLVGTLRAGRLVRRTVGHGRVAAVLFDRDGTLIEDVPYNGDPAAVAVVPGARHALDRLRAAGIRIGVVTNQSGVARGLVSRAQVEEVNTRLVQLLGPIDVIAVCEHGQDAGCDCRKPAPGLVLRAAAQLGVPAARCAVVGDIGTDVEAAAAAGASAILVPNAATRRDEITAASCVAGDLATAVDLLLGATT